MELHMTNKLLDDMKHYSKAERIRQVLEDENPEALLADNLDNALIGVYRPRWEETDLPVAVYSVCKIISELVKDGMDEEEALEFYDFNIWRVFPFCVVCYSIRFVSFCGFKHFVYLFSICFSLFFIQTHCIYGFV